MVFTISKKDSDIICTALPPICFDTSCNLLCSVAFTNAFLKGSQDLSGTDRRHVIRDQKNSMSKMNQEISKRKIRGNGGSYFYPKKRGIPSWNSWKQQIHTNPGTLKTRLMYRCIPFNHRAEKTARLGQFFDFATKFSTWKKTMPLWVQSIQNIRVGWCEDPENQPIHHMMHVCMTPKKHPRSMAILLKVELLFNNILPQHKNPAACLAPCWGWNVHPVTWRFSVFFLAKYISDDNSTNPY